MIYPSEYKRLLEKVGHPHISHEDIIRLLLDYPNLIGSNLELITWDEMLSDDSKEVVRFVDLVYFDKYNKTYIFVEVKRNARNSCAVNQIAEYITMSKRMEYEPCYGVIFTDYTSEFMLHVTQAFEQYFGIKIVLKVYNVDISSRIQVDDCLFRLIIDKEEGDLRWEEITKNYKKIGQKLSWRDL